MKENKPKFKFQLNQVVEIGVSGEWGHIKGRAEYTTQENGYFIHYKAANGLAVQAWFDESDLVEVFDDAHPNCPVFAVTAAALSELDK